MLFSKKKKQTGSSPSTDYSMGAAMKIGTVINKAHNAFGSTLNKKTAHLSKNGKILMLIGILLFFGAGSMYVMVDGLRHKDLKIVPPANHITVPPIIQSIEPRTIPQANVAPLQELRRIIKFKHYLDSLKADPIGRKVYDSILFNRPGLIDSIGEVINLYNADSASILDP